MGTTYKDDRPFTDYVHQHLALPIIYKQLGWTELDMSEYKLENIDINNGIDYVFKSDEKQEIFVQERFRDNYYQSYNDFTLRYRRDNNPDVRRQASEFFKMQADYVVYGITNGKKFADARHTLTDFIKFAVIDVHKLYLEINAGNIIIPNSYQRLSKIENGKLIAAKMANKDGSSDFVAFDIQMLNQLFKEKGLILLQKGFKEN